MAEVELTEDTLVIHVRGMDRIFALKSELEIPLSHVMGAEADPDLGHPEWWKSLRFTATQIPWVVSAGTFYQEGERVFWDVHDPKKAVMIRLRDERYARLVIGVDDPPATVRAVQEALGEEWSTQPDLLLCTNLAGLCVLAHPPNGVHLLLLGSCERIANFLELRQREVRATLQRNRLS